jgi:hypothetical protein
MKYIPILNAIEAMLAADVSTKDLIKGYRQVTLPEQGTWDTPLCVIAPDLDIEPNLAGYAPTVVRNETIPISVHLLERSYIDTDQHIVAVTNLDTLQHNVCSVFQADLTLSSSVSNSKITRKQLQRYNEEYFEFVITLTINTKLE